VSQQTSKFITNSAITNAKIANSTIDLTAKVTGALPVANGGTGQTSAANAFGALSPLTTKGDIVSYSTANARLAVGANGYSLVADSTQATGLKWARPVAVGIKATSGQITLSTNTVIFGSGAVDVDSDSAYSTANGKFTVPTGKAGVYMIGVKFMSSSATNDLYIRLNNSTNIARLFACNAAGGNFAMTGNIIVSLAVGDTIQLESGPGAIAVYTTSNDDNHFTINSIYFT
jgi:uncharacterized protein YhdP